MVSSIHTVARVLANVPGYLIVEAPELRKSRKYALALRLRSLNVKVHHEVLLALNIQAIVDFE